jgi:hypothetical protein
VVGVGAPWRYKRELSKPGWHNKPAGCSNSGGATHRGPLEKEEKEPWTGSITAFFIVSLSYKNTNAKVVYMLYIWNTLYKGFLQHEVTGQCPLFSQRHTKCSNYQLGLSTLNHRMLTWVSKVDERRTDDRVCFVQVYFWDGRGSGSTYGWRAPCDGVSVWRGVTTVAWEAYCSAVRASCSHLFPFAATPIVSHSRMAAILEVCSNSESQF